MLTRPLLIYDGDCSFCKRWIARWRRLTADAIDYEPSQTAAERFPQIQRDEFGKSVFLIEPDGTIARGAEAVFKSLALAKQKRHLYWLHRHVRPFAWLADVGYRFIAHHRDPIDKLDRLIIGTETLPPSYLLTRALFLRGIGLVYFIAFLSLFVQIDGLVGANGISPAANFLAAVTKHFGASRWWTLPTLAYFNSSDAFLHALCITGIIASVGLMIGLVPMLTTIVLWASYLSLVTVGQIFLQFQWDALLLEAGFLAILFSPPWWAGAKVRPSNAVLFLIRWLLFRLMVLSALVKWFSGDDAWGQMTALRHHFETQPIPAWTSWFAHYSPHWMLAAGCAGMFVIEALVPFLYFGPRRMRMLAFWLTVLLQLGIMATGNYGFFNILTIVLAFSLLDDAALARVCRCRIPTASLRRPRLRYALVWPLAAVIFIVTTMAAVERLAMQRIPWPQPLAALEDYVTPFHSTNAYGLFQVMTKDRPEVIIEGSDDQRDWKEYELKWKPGDITRRPRFCQPHMPRLDWQLWFAALHPARNEGWMQNLAYRLLTAQPEVLKLIDKNPFPDRPPRYIRAAIYDYRFSTPAQRKETGAWWTRKPLRLYLGPMQLQRSAAEESLRL